MKKTCSAGRFLIAWGLGRREGDFIGRAAQVHMKRRETD